MGKVLAEAARAASDYWYTEAGVLRRIEMLSQSFSYKIVNGALLAYGAAGGIKRWRWTTAGDSRVCPVCDRYDGRIYRAGQFLPPLPAHAGCRCAWELMFDPDEIPSYVA